MKTIIDFTYYTVFTVVPDRATLGKSTGAATLHAAMFSFFYLAVWMWINEFFITIEISPYIEVFLVFGGHYVFNWSYFLNEAKQRCLQNEYGDMKKWKLKVIGILFILVCFFSFVFSGIALGFLRHKVN